jgi:hypothetical protein
MKVDRFLKFALAVIALSLIVLVGEGWNKSSKPVQAAARQQWEYKTMQVNLNFDRGKLAGLGGLGEDFDHIKGDDVMAELGQLGSQGWEMVGMMPMSTSAEFQTTNAGGLNGYSFGGATTAYIVAFKRAKP